MSGAQIGGTIGSVIGSYFGPIGAQVGYAIGSYIGGYIDPTKIKGPQLKDAAQQTSSVGVPLPFGYGTFSTAGNVIWSDELKEHVKRKRDGKGGTTKTTTYTYTRSYAIGVCEGPIYGYLMVKRNGKVVYNSDPNAPVADKDYSTKWLQRATLYYGNETQMPDSTIEAVEGAGNVAAFRGLAYIVIENEDLTDLAGAVPQYEFIVQATLPDVYVTSRPYPILSEESVGIAVTPLAGTLRTIMWQQQYSDDMGIAVAPISGELRDQYWKRTVTDNIGISVAPISGTLRTLGVSTEYEDELGISVAPQSGTLRLALITANPTVDDVGISVEPISGTLA